MIKTESLQQRQIKGLLANLYRFLYNGLLKHPIFLLLFSACLFALSFPSGFAESSDHFPFLLLQSHLQCGIPWLIFVFTIPLLCVLLQLRRLSEAFFYGAFYGFSSYLLLSLWLLDYDWIAFILIPSIYFVYFSLFFAGFVLLSRYIGSFNLSLHYTKGLRYAAFLLLWMLLELAKSTGWVAYTYGTLLYSHYLSPAVMAFSTNFWLQNISYILILLPAICMHALGVKYREGSPVQGAASNGQLFWQNRETQGLLLLTVLALVILHQSFSGKRTEVVSLESNGSDVAGDSSLPVSTDYFNIALLQHNINSWQTEENTNRQALASLLELSRKAEARRAELIVWSETAFVPVFRFNRMRDLEPAKQNLEDLEVQIQNTEDAQQRRKLASNLAYFRSTYDDLLMAHELQQYLEQARAMYLIGSNDYGQPEEFPGERRWALYNSLLLIQSGQILASYHKQRLVPFTEEAKWDKWLPKLNALLQRNGFAQYSAGKSSPVLQVPLQNKLRSSLKIYSMICYEDSLPLYWPHRLWQPRHLAAALAKNDFDILLSVSNDSWSSSPIGGLQHLSSALSRALETGRYFLRGSTSGQTAAVSPQGQILKRLEPNRAGILYFRLPLEPD